MVYAKEIPIAHSARMTKIQNVSANANVKMMDLDPDLDLDLDP
jgi:hypothetical protein